MDSKTSQSINAVSEPQWKVSETFVKWLNKGNSTFTRKRKANLKENKSNTQFRNINLVDNFYDNPAMTQSTDIALVSNSTRYRESYRKNMNFRELSNPATWNREEDSAAEIIVTKPHKSNPLQAVNHKVHLVQ